MDDTSLERYGIRVNADTSKREAVVHPDHYRLKNGMEAMEVIDAVVEDTDSFLLGNILKYLCRFRKKNGVEDLKKAAQYLRLLIEKYE